jgi:hypothetical protein
MLPARRLFIKPLQVPSRNLDLSLLTFEIAHWSDHFGSLLPKARSHIHSRKAKQLHRQWIRRELHPVPALAHHLDPHLDREHNTDPYYADSFPHVEDWVRWTPSFLRQFWTPPTEPERIHPPLRIGPSFASLLPKAAWRFFWKSESLTAPDQYGGDYYTINFPIERGCINEPRQHFPLLCAGFVRPL